MEAIYIAIAVIAAGVGFFVYSRYFKESKDTPKISEGTASVPKPEPLSESVSNIAIDTVSIDQKYADTHGMWICTYCETMNKYPAGMTTRRKTVEEPKTLPIEGKSGLRGDLLNKANTSRAGSVGASDVLTCIACGKHQCAVST